MCSKYDLNPRSLTIGNNRHRLASWQWRDIINSTGATDRVGEVFRANSRLQVGDGVNILFWSDCWIRNMTLRDRFPRIYALACNKSGTVVEFGRKVVSSWRWEIKLRRPLFGWEIAQWDEFLATINSLNSDGYENDCLIWKGTGDGQFSVGSFYKLIENENPTDNFWKISVWNGLAPPRVEFFLWQVICNRLAVKSELLKRGIGAVDSSGCPLCNTANESVTHLFLACEASWKLWMLIIAEWNLNFVIPGDVRTLLTLWFANPLNENDKSVWFLIPSAVLWSLWLHRNEVVFRKIKPDVNSLFFVVKTRIATWYCARFPSFQVSMNDIVNNLRYADGRFCSTSKGADSNRWRPPEEGFIKVNVDGAMLADRGAGGIGGLARDHMKRILFQFSEGCGPGPPVLAELLAIKRGLELLLSEQSCNRGRPIIESDSSLAINWINKNDDCPAVFSRLVNDIAEVGKSRGCIFSIIPRVRNIDADALAKTGIG
ncbi:hypothetical protein like AT4G29090 [Hibiscus trionum]|uniref:RNase H type-1 domain-containing protein n=1 Tax=Hibiscus trionum TaxID=183268 RepID=A0A9W7J8T3_HIBTR|nr:hypothetical protein like AT4G29090 [Hibiscus trionum]